MFTDIVFVFVLFLFLTLTHKRFHNFFGRIFSLIGSNNNSVVIVTTTRQHPVFVILTDSECLSKLIPIPLLPNRLLFLFQYQCFSFVLFVVRVLLFCHILFTLLSQIINLWILYLHMCIKNRANGDIYKRFNNKKTVGIKVKKENQCLTWFIREIDRKSEQEREWHTRSDTRKSTTHCIFTQSAHFFLMSVISRMLLSEKWLRLIFHFWYVRTYSLIYLFIWMRYK